MDNKIKHLEFIQGSISRMAQCSFQMKGWAIALLTAIMVLYGESDNAMYIVWSILILIIFWGLDGYYLYKERKFRELYNNVVDDIHVILANTNSTGSNTAGSVKEFCMEVDNRGWLRGWLGACASPVNSGMYGVVIALLAIYSCYIHI